ncbi:MAG: transcriptional regulator [Verrucomicrobia bacterium]|nr:transcriptional regulator [Verrucomicrobiota bacterium]
MNKLRPTLWRTCRVLACETRLEMLRLLFKKGELCVSEMADLTGISAHNASTQLRALNARGLITLRRENQKVIYRAEANGELSAAPTLLEAVRNAFEKKTPVRTVFHLCTAFTHDRRVWIVRILTEGPQSFGELLEKTGMSPSALWNHLEKLSARGFVKKQGGHYRLARVKDPLRRALRQTACE